MKTQFQKLVVFLCTLSFCVSAQRPRASGQTRRSLGLQFSAGQPTITITGTAGAVYSIQYSTGLSATNLWTDRTLVQV